MSNFIRTFVCFGVLVLMPLTGLTTGEKAEDAGSLQVTISKVVAMKEGGIRLDWRLTNPSNSPLFVYSTFLRGPATEWGAQGEVCEIHTSLAEKMFDVQLNYYPKAEFMEIEPGGERNGVFADSRPSAECQKSHPKGMIFLVGYGSDIRAVKEALQRVYSSNSLHPEHPANPIVDWQHIAKSNAVAFAH